MFIWNESYLITFTPVLPILPNAVRLRYFKSSLSSMDSWYRLDLSQSSIHELGNCMRSDSCPSSCLSLSSDSICLEKSCGNNCFSGVGSNSDCIRILKITFRMWCQLPLPSCFKKVTSKEVFCSLLASWTFLTLCLFTLKPRGMWGLYTIHCHYCRNALSMLLLPGLAAARWFCPYKAVMLRLTWCWGHCCEPQQQLWEESLQTICLTTYKGI